MKQPSYDVVHLCIYQLNYVITMHTFLSNSCSMVLVKPLSRWIFLLSKRVSYGSCTHFRRCDKEHIIWGKREVCQYWQLRGIHKCKLNEVLTPFMRDVDGYYGRSKCGSQINLLIAHWEVKEIKPIYTNELTTLW